MKKEFTRYSVLQKAVATAGLVISLSASLTSAAALADSAAPGDADRNWVAMHIFDSFYPFSGEQTFPDALASVEVLYQLYTKREMVRDISRSLGGLKHGDHQGDRSREGHYTLWIHLSNHYLSEHPIDRQALGDGLFMYPDHNNDIFTGWGGSVNLAALLTEGISGFAVPIKNPATGALDGSFQNFMNDIVPMGDADYEGGWYMTDDQASKILTAFPTYGGLTQGYSFMSSTSKRPNAPYDPPGAQLGNGYNCGDFAFYALNTAGVISKAEAESLKVQFWYPRYYFDHALPLAGTGAAGAHWLAENPGQTSIPQAEMVKIGWEELLFGPLGLQFFDKREIAQVIVDQQLEVIPARIWDQAHVITWLKNRNEFPSKGIWTELLPAVLSDTPITSPVRTVHPDGFNRFVLSRDYNQFQSWGRGLENHKLNQARIFGFAGDEFARIFNSLKHPF